jgi:AGZA family xanthine/uracil permease-like MFS transporter
VVEPALKRLPWFTSGDVDGLFGLFFSGFPDLLLIVGLAPVCGFSVEFVTARVLPGVALSVLAGNLFYAWQARRLAKATGRDDVTAIPFGVNTPTIFAYVFLIMGPVYARTHDATPASSPACSAASSKPPEPLAPTGYAVIRHAPPCYAP